MQVLIIKNDFPEIQSSHSFRNVRVVVAVVVICVCGEATRLHF